MTTESFLQVGVILELQKEGYIAINIITASANGVSDVLACDPWGVFCAFETKLSYNSLSTLQVNFINNVRSRGGIAGCVKNIDDLRKLLKSDRPMPPIKTTISKIDL